MYRTKALPRIFENEVLRQVLDLHQAGCETVSPRSLVSFAAQGIIPQPEGGGGRGMRKTFHPETAAEIFANSYLKSKSASIDKLREVRRLAALIEDNEPGTDGRLVIDRNPDIARTFKGKELEVLYVALWIREKGAALEIIYADQFKREASALEKTLKRSRLDKDLRRFDEIKYDHQLLAAARSGMLSAHLSVIASGELKGERISDEWESYFAKK